MRADDLINIMESFVGTEENPPGSNRTPIGNEFGFNGVAWCAETVSVACNRLGFPLHEAAVSRIEAHARSGDWGMGWTRKPVRGAVVCFDWNGHGNPADMHCGIVTDVLDGGRFRTIEGNYHDSCQRVLRDMTYVRGFATFPFDGAAPAPSPVTPSPPAPTPQNRPELSEGMIGTWVSKVQQIIRDHAGGDIRVDGNFGPQTARRVEDVQHLFDLEVDGVVGPKTWAVLDYIATKA